GGLHPVSIGDVFPNGSFKVLHKLGFGCSSTVWLARDQRPQSSALDTLVALEILPAAQSSRLKDEIVDIVVPSPLYAFATALHSSACHNILAVKDHFMVQGPNGQHLCIISQVAGPSVLFMSRTEMRLAGSKRLRGEEGGKANRHRGGIHAFHFTSV
ncbi:hypothetical protein F5887DRAFT_1232706, partial [Amanita rubescens]